MKSLENLRIEQEMIVKDPEKYGEFEDVEKKWLQKILDSPENLKIGKELTVTDTEKSGQFEELKRNDYKRYWKVRRIWSFEQKLL